MSAISHAELTVHLTIAYFAPDPQLLKALTDAARRGVDVKLVLPSYSDSGAIFHLGRSYYTELLRGGVKIYELRGAVMHAKTACIDGVWSTIGSTNLDWRSFLHNDEINAVILGRGFAAQMEAMFAADLTESEAITLDQWKHRSLAAATEGAQRRDSARTGCSLATQSAAGKPAPCPGRKNACEITRVDDPAGSYSAQCTLPNGFCSLLR